MKWGLILILALSIALLGCNPTPQNETAANPEAEEVSFDDAMGNTIAPGTWLTDYDEALAIAKKLDRPVLINFTGSDWCGWCIKLSDEVFSKDIFKKYAAENLVLLKLDFPRKIKQTPELKAANESLAKKFGIEGFPTIILVDYTGKKLAQTGYQAGGAQEYVDHIKVLLTQEK